LHTTFDTTILTKWYNTIVMTEIYENVIAAGLPPEGTASTTMGQKGLELQAQARANLQTGTSLLNKLAEQADNPFEWADALYLIDGHFNKMATEQQESLTEQVRENFDAIMEVLDLQARAGSRESFTLLANLSKLPDSAPSWYGSYMDKEYVMADDWNDVVAIALPNPRIDDFRDVDAIPEAGSVRRIAASALINENLRDAKIAMAYCNGKQRKFWIDEIGPIMMAKIAQMIARMEQGM
jgi:hypothetical protein